MDTPPTSRPSSDRLPGWLVEALDVLSARRRIVVATAVGLVLLGAIVALVAPSILPARAVVGAAVGIAAALLATALALAMDASDLVVRGVRHVRAAGGTVDVHVGRQHDDVGPLLAAVARHATDGQLRVALSSASRTAGVPGVRASALAEALARTGRKVLLTDLARGGTPAAGLSDVIAGSRTLPEVVRFEQELYLARLAVGSDPDVAIRGFAGWVEGLPSDLEVLVAALPPLADPGVLAAAGAMDVTLVLVEVDRTERVDLIASLDAVDASGLTSELVLVDPERTPMAAAPVSEDEFEEAPDEPEHDADEPEHDAEVSVAGDDVAAEPAEPADAVTGPDEHGDAAESDESSEVDDVLAAIGLDRPDEEPSGPATTAAPEDDHDDRDTGSASDAGVGEVAGLLGSAAAASAGAATPPVPGEGEPHADDDPTAADVTHTGADDAVASEGVATDADATAEIPLTPHASDVDLSHIWDAPSAGTTSDEVEPEPSVDQPTSGPVAPEPVVPEPVAPEPVAPAAVDEPAVDEEPVPAEDAVDATPSHDPAPRPVPAAASGSDRSELSADPAALEVARTSAALHQLAQQIWERDDR